VRLGALNAEKHWGSGASYGATEVMHPGLSGMIRDQIQDSKSLTARMTGIIRTRRIPKEASTHMATIEQSEARRARSPVHTVPAVVQPPPGRQAPLARDGPIQWTRTCGRRIGKAYGGRPWHDIERLNTLPSEYGEFLTEKQARQAAARLRREALRHGAADKWVQAGDIMGIMRRRPPTAFSRGTWSTG
jgi:hypothetical protein